MQNAGVERLVAVYPQRFRLVQRAGGHVRRMSETPFVEHGLHQLYRGSRRIKSAFFHIRPHIFGNESENVQSEHGVYAYLCGGNAPARIGELRKTFAETAFKIFPLRLHVRIVPVPPEHREIGRGENPFGIAPGLEIDQHIPADDKIKLAFGIFFLQMFQRFIGIAGAAPLDFVTAHVRAPPRKGEPAHFQPVRRGRALAVHLMRRHESGHHDQPVERKLPHHAVRHRYMFSVHGVESPAQHANPFHDFILAEPSRFFKPLRLIFAGNGNN